MRVLLIGGSGQLGTAIRRCWTDCEILAPPHSALNLADLPALRSAAERTAPDVLVNAAAFHDVDTCEREPEAAFSVNAIAVGHAARLARDRGAIFLTISTDYVFDGASRAPYAEFALPRPLSVYGASKVAGEHLALAAGGKAYVVRTCGVYGSSATTSRRPLIRRVLNWRSGEAPLRVVNDVYVSPTFADHLAGALRRLIATQAHGLYHAVNEGPVSWYDFAVETARAAGREMPLEPIAASQWRTQATRPAFSALANAGLARLGIAMPDWRDGIRAYLRSLGVSATVR
ncbi:MAG: dTDP-4-dehydrorhamnose reductase [Candidatus Eremiobacteraeota bacterium]|nr:dTDP-4-dehydrorhamnose reductase [Candidatus Eremiobacteraeota bacterium]